MSNYKVSIITPIYGVEKYIKKCAISLFEQDFKDIEYIFVNDCTKDKSIEILKDVIQNYPNKNIKIINHDKNKGLGQARKTGTQLANGEYIMHIDSDDWCEHDMISALYQAAKEKNADIVSCNWIEEYGNNSSSKLIQHNYNKLNGSDCYFDFLGGYILAPNVWSKFYKKELFNDVKFADFSYGEDLFLNTQIFKKAKKVIFLNKAFVHYNKENTNSITHHQKDIKEEFIHLHKSIYGLLKTKIEKNIKDRYILITCIKLFYPHHKEVIDKIDPKIYSLKTIWGGVGAKINSLNFIKKIVYSLVLIKCGFIFRLALNFKKRLKL
ncbi:hypothetical protein CR66_06940 [Campylobacter mucosalis]|uniref:glycosyltransferase family 2 protein n=1 Tax=Campylobacter mucosalis TaxID=202 RepID=UPI0004D76861|nr:glycosyltransferase family 2 protein [Campylobacter mucosalis]KEA45560.1 hypothetical protein CR66_06940 [Campylobacter mucosalis]QKF63258.1 glycosyltransferase, family 2 [Campylobacter mucosalis]